MKHAHPGQHGHHGHHADGAAAADGPAAAAVAGPETAHAPDDPVAAQRKRTATALFWVIGLFAVAACGAYMAFLPMIRENEAFGLLDRIPIALVKAQSYDADHTLSDKHLINPITQKAVGLDYEAYVGTQENSLPDNKSPDLDARRNFIALADLCGRNPHLGMRVFRQALAAPMTKDGFPQRLLAGEMLFFLRDAHDRFPDDPTLPLTMKDIYRVAELANGEMYRTGAARRSADLLTLILAFPASLPDRIPVRDLNGAGTKEFVRAVYLVPEEYAGVKFRQPFFEQGQDALLLLNYYKKDNFVWNEKIKRFMFSGATPEQIAPDTPDNGATPNPG
ncbi:MAG: hypothetical protein ACREJ2_00740, partial [Planctomycetota bacterium]